MISNIRFNVPSPKLFYKMLKCYIFIVAIYFFEVFNNSRVQCEGCSNYYHCTEGEAAEKRFLEEEGAIANNIDKRKKNRDTAKGNLSVGNTLATLAPRKTFNIFKQAWHYFKKIGRAVIDMANIMKRDREKQKLREEKNRINNEPLISGLRPDGKSICAKAFKHDYFSKVKEWDLVPEHRATKSPKKKWIRVQTAHQKEKRKIWRSSKLCMAKKKDDQRPFPVYISAAQEYRKSWGYTNYKIFVFTKTPWKEIDGFNKFFFFTQTVVKVAAYLW